MADKKITALVELLKAAITNDDEFAIVNAGETKRLKIGAVFSTVTDMITAAITAFRESLGILVLQASAPIANTVNLTFEKIEVVDSVFLDHAHGNTSYDFDTDTLTINADGVYEFSILAAFTAPNNETITFATYKNGGKLGEVTYDGNGTKEVSLVGSLFAELVAGDAIDIRAKSTSAATLVTLQSSQYRCEKTPHH